MVERQGSDKIFNAVVNTVMGLFCLMVFIPLLHVLANSFSSPEAVYRGLVGLLPVDLSFEAYVKVFQESSILNGYKNTLIYTAIGTVIQLVLQFTMAYPLSRKDLKYRNIVSGFLVLTMFVNGGMIPTYLVVKDLKMINTIWAMIIPGCVSVFNIIIIRTYIQTSVPWGLQEAAMIDGSSQIGIFVKIVLPLCKPIIAVMTLYAIVGYWNSYFNSLLYLPNDKLWPLQRVLQRILVANETGSLGGGTLGQQEQAMLAASLKYTVIIVATVPILFIYPFFQKFFEKGIMVGGLKG